MLRCHRLLICSLVLINTFVSGCASFGIKNGVPYFGKQDQYEPPIEEEDKWAIAGKIGRGNRPLDDERDPVKKMIMSPEAQNIERNLGYK
jgi:hypothetical protein